MANVKDEELLERYIRLRYGNRAPQNAAQFNDFLEQYKKEQRAKALREAEARSRHSARPVLDAAQGSLPKGPQLRMGDVNRDSYVHMRPSSVLGPRPVPDVGQGQRPKVPSIPTAPRMHGRAAAEGRDQPGKNVGGTKETTPAYWNHFGMKQDQWNNLGLSTQQELVGQYNKEITPAYWERFGMKRDQWNNLGFSTQQEFIKRYNNGPSIPTAPGKPDQAQSRTLGERINDSLEQHINNFTEWIGWKPLGQDFPSKQVRMGDVNRDSYAELTNKTDPMSLPTTANAADYYVYQPVLAKKDREAQDTSWAKTTPTIPAPDNYSGNIDLNARPKIQNADGSYSTVESMTFGVEVDGKKEYILLPSVIKDATGNWYREQDEGKVWDYYQKTGENLGLYSTIEQAEAAANAIQDQQTAQYITGKKATSYMDDKAQILDQYEAKLTEQAKDILTSGQYGDMGEKVLAALNDGAELYQIVPTLGGNMQIDTAEDKETSLYSWSKLLGLNSTQFPQNETDLRQQYEMNNRPDFLVNKDVIAKGEKSLANKMVQDENYGKTADEVNAYYDKIAENPHDAGSIEILRNMRLTALGAAMLTDDEKAHVNYLYGIGDTKSADRVLAQYENKHRAEVNQQEAVDFVKPLTPTALDSKGQRIVKRVGAALLTADPIPGITEAGVGTVQNLINLISQNDLPIPETSASGWLRIQNAAGQAATSGMTGPAKFIGDAAVSSLQNLPLVATGPAGPYIIAANATGRAMLQGSDAGLSTGEATKFGLAYGLAEYFGEKVSFGNLRAIAENPGNGVFKAILAQAGVEFGEESTTEAVQVITDISILKDKSDLVQYFNNYLATHDDKIVDAVFATAAQIGSRILQAGASGVIAGIPMGSIASVSGRFQNASANRLPPISSYQQSGQRVQTAQSVPTNALNTTIDGSYKPSTNSDTRTLMRTLPTAKNVQNTTRTEVTRGTLPDVRVTAPNPAEPLNSPTARDGSALLVDHTAESLAGINVNTRGTMRNVEQLAKGQGLTVRWVQDATMAGTDQQVNGYLDRNNKTLVINTNSNANPIHITAAHELTHGVENTSVYEGLRQFIVNSMESGTVEQGLGRLREQYRGVYDATQLNDRVNKEFVANWVGENLGNRAVIRQMANADRGLVGKVLNVLDKLIGRAPDRIKGDLRTVRNMWADALREGRSIPTKYPQTANNIGRYVPQFSLENKTVKTQSIPDARGAQRDALTNEDATLTGMLDKGGPKEYSEGAGETFTQGSKIPAGVLETKPKYSPIPDKWLDNGGQITIENGAWKYTNTQGDSVTYKNGYPDFKGSGHVKQEVDIGGFANRTTDFKKADQIAPNGPKSPDNTWHHYEDGKTLQEVDKKIHEQFRHEGGIAGMKKNK